ncbi:NifB/NifX family molybdenum-iron cluster-binding protein [Paenibacillus wynnii]|uniref:NifB/NifX family molybdenum-iron cluster-binding protein n=1 Tax=Paenibacillus wynnii TaxID=268407 RepID=UPI00279455B1|nr:NifB/NifX family molybdenum-iron cluster-binding protein [Paenibacillus wynnii]MDQ0194634.1 nitrogen fixation protein NifX [Paenibacillus wynnii]
MKVAFATDDGIRVNAHFGQSPMFAVYNVTKSGGELLELRKLPDVLFQDEAGRINSRLEAVGDCTLIFLMQIGASAAARVTRRKIMPVKVPFGSPVDEQVKRLVEMLQGKPPMWLAKVLRSEEEGQEGTEGENLNGTDG